MDISLLIVWIRIWNNFSCGHPRHRKYKIGSTLYLKWTILDLNGIQMDILRREYIIIGKKQCVMDFFYASCAENC